MTQAKSGDTVKVHYTGKLDDGTVFDSSAQREPLEFTLGAGQVIPGFEQTIVGMNTGETKTTTIPADDAYGPRRDEMVVTVDQSEFPSHIEPEIGKQLQLPQPDGRAIVATITEVSDGQVTLDANHPLAGRDLTFELELVDVS
jgi:peptidylprolyl isomerase